MSVGKRNGWIAEGIGCVPLTRGQVALVDPDLLGILTVWNWSALPLNGGFYAVRRTRGTLVYMHRQVLAEPSGDVDHRNGNSLDNRRANLRKASRSENNANARLSRHNVSGYKGVVYCAFHPRNPWRARINVEGTRHSLGFYATAKQAADAYDEAAVKFFGEFARTNAML